MKIFHVPYRIKNMDFIGDDGINGDRLYSRYGSLVITASSANIAKEAAFAQLMTIYPTRANDISIAKIKTLVEKA